MFTKNIRDAYGWLTRPLSIMDFELNQVMKRGFFGITVVKRGIDLAQRQGVSNNWWWKCIDWDRWKLDLYLPSLIHKRYKLWQVSVCLYYIFQNTVTLESNICSIQFVKVIYHQNKCVTGKCIKVAFEQRLSKAKWHHITWKIMTNVMYLHRIATDTLKMKLYWYWKYTHTLYA